MYEEYTFHLLYIMFNDFYEEMVLSGMSLLTTKHKEMKIFFQRNHQLISYNSYKNVQCFSKKLLIHHSFNFIQLSKHTFVWLNILASE